MLAIQGGFTINPADERLLLEQRTITYNVNQNFIQVGAIFLKTSSKNPFHNDWFARGHRDTNLQGWIDDPDSRILNVGFNLQFGWLDIDIDSDDPEYNRCLMAALRHCGVDTRFSFGRSSLGVPSHVMVKLSDEESPNFNQMKKFEPNAFWRKGKKFKTELRSFATNIPDKNLVREAKQTVMPGSVYVSKQNSSEYDISVWYAGDGTVAHSIGQIANTTPRTVTFNFIIRAISFGTVLYFLKPHWTEGTRQTTAQKVSGWLARVVKDSQGFNNNESIANDVYCPIDSDDIAESLLKFICNECGDDEFGMRIRTFSDARRKLDRNPDAHIPGWPSIAQAFGDEAANALRAVLMPGADVSILMKMSERYIYDETDNMYIDRDRFGSAIAFVHDGVELDRRHRGDFVRVAGKPYPAFKLFEISSIRKRVSSRDLYPGIDAGGIFRLDRTGEQVSDDSDEPSITVFNTWRGWPLDVPQAVSSGLLNTCEANLNQLLEYLTRKNQRQMEWIKKWIAWIIQHPDEKQQVAPVIVGGQGIGKSFFGNTFLSAIFGYLWGSASPKVLENTFSIEPFIGRMLVFIDEAKFHSESATDEIKKLIRNVSIGGSEKYKSARNYNIFARVVFASNKFEMNIGQANVQDRALYYIKAMDKDYYGWDDHQFRQWAVGLKPFFDDFNGFLRRRDAREHYMHMFMTLPVTRYEIEDIATSSATDTDIISANMSWPRRILKHIIEDGRIYEDLDISVPFQSTDLNRRITEVCSELNMRNVPVQRVMAELKETGLIESYVEGVKIYWRFRYKIGTLTEEYGKHIATVMEPRFVFDASDMGPNTTTIAEPLPWKGVNRRIFGKL